MLLEKRGTEFRLVGGTKGRGWRTGPVCVCIEGFHLSKKKNFQAERLACAKDQSPGQYLGNKRLFFQSTEEKGGELDFGET